MRFNKPYFQINSRFFPLGFHEQGHNCDLYKVLKSYTKLSEITFYKIIKIVDDIFDLFAFILYDEPNKVNGKLWDLNGNRSNLNALKHWIINRIDEYELLNEEERARVNPAEFDKYADESENYLIDFLYCQMARLKDEKSNFFLWDILALLWLNGEYREIKRKDSATAGDTK